MAKRPALRERQRKAVAASAGYRPISAAEKRALGLPASNRSYIPIGAPKVTKGALVGRRAVEQYGGYDRSQAALLAQHGELQAALGGKSFDRIARERKLAGAGRNAKSRYTNALDAFAQQRGITKGEARKDAEFTDAYKRLKNNYRAPIKNRSARNVDREKMATIGRLNALHDLGLMDDDEYDYLVERWELGSP